MPEIRTPLVSVCIPTYGHARFLRTAIESVLAQSMQDFEVVVSDDGSDESELIAEMVQSHPDPRIRFLRQAQHGGVATNRNACLSAARGCYIAWLDADDAYDPDALRRLSESLGSHPSAAFAHAGFSLIDGDGTLLKGWSSGPSEDTVELSRDAFRELAACNYVTTSTVLVRRETQDQAGLFDPSIGRSSTDWNMWLRLALQGDVVYVRQPLTRYRRHADTISAHTAASGERLQCDERAVLSVFSSNAHQILDRSEMLTMSQAALSIRWLLHAQTAYRTSDARGAARALLRAVRLSRLLTTPGAWRALVKALRDNDDYAAFQAFRTVLRHLYPAVANTRYSEEVRKLAVPDTGWETTVVGCASAVRRATEEGSLVAAIDKHDPSLLHFSGRKGVHFPETGTYPRDDEEAIQGVVGLPARGIRYLVIPGFSFWWLDFYQGLAAHLQDHCTSIWDDSRCKIYEFS